MPDLSAAKKCSDKQSFECAHIPIEYADKTAVYVVPQEAVCSFARSRPPMVVISTCVWSSRCARARKSSSAWSPISDAKIKAPHLDALIRLLQDETQAPRWVPIQDVSELPHRRHRRGRSRPNPDERAVGT